ncbi:MAG: homocysteine S-methyltransferase family protein [Thermoguttaceae bacterium]|nr:homocysteine S-methyltransferase family protein [Thermoguttaceae bacterium]MDW8038916.1 homocysteine S-methyltransferase family protein [Thermoguttaceae bacterium]
MHVLIEQLTSTGPVVTDGAWGTQLQQLGLPVGQCPERWNLEHPDRVQQVAQSYVEAGSLIILTNTFGGNRFSLARYGLAEHVRQINQAGVQISLQAAGQQALVFASVGPSGKMLLTGDTTADQLESVFLEQCEVLAEAGADGLVIETMSDLEEALIAVRAAKTTGLPVVACMVFASGRDKDRTLMGNSPEQAAEALSQAGADVVGANCGQGIEGFLSICRRLRTATDRPIWIKPNAGLPQLVDGQVRYSQTPEHFASYVPALLEAGAAFLGGCCGTTPDFIRAIRNQLAQLG